MTADEIKAFLTERFVLEKKRLSSYGTKYSMGDIAHAVYRHIEALMSNSRYRELKRAYKEADRYKKVLGTEPTYRKYLSYLQERMKATKAMSRAIKHVAETNDKNRPWKRTVKQEKKKKDKKKAHHSKKHRLAGKVEHRDDRGRLPHADWCRSNKMGPCNCGRGY